MGHTGRSQEFAEPFHVQPRCSKSHSVLANVHPVKATRFGTIVNERHLSTQPLEAFGLFFKCDIGTNCNFHSTPKSYNRTTHENFKTGSFNNRRKSDKLRVTRRTQTRMAFTQRFTRPGFDVNMIGLNELRMQRLHGSSKQFSDPYEA